MSCTAVDRIFAWLCLALALLALSWAGPRQAFADQNDKVVVQLRWVHQFQFAGYYAALENGYYREAGLDVELAEGGPGRNPIEEVTSGRAQYGTAASEVLLARLRGKPVKVLAVIFQQSPAILLARKISGINSPQDMLGQRVMLMPGMDDAELLAMFLKEGVKLDKIHRLPTSFDVEDLISGKTDAFNAYLTNEPFYLETRGMEPAIIRPSLYGIQFYGDCVFTSEEEARRNPQRVKDFRQATLRGWQYAMDHPEEIVELILSKYPTKKSREHLRYEAAAMRDLLQPEMIEIGHMNPGRWRHMADTFAELGLVPKGFKLDGLVYDPNAERDLTPLLWVAGVAGAILLVVGVVTAGLVKFNLRLKREVEERARAERRFTTMAANVPGAIVQMRARADGSRRYTYLSPRAQEFFGMEPEEAIAQRRLLNWHPEDAPRVSRQIAASFAAGAGHNVVGRIILPDGEEKWVNLTAVPSGREGEVILYDGFILDVTERKLAELEYLASERKIKAMSQAVDDALVMLDSRGRVVFFNPAAERLFGYTAEEAQGMEFHAVAMEEGYRDQARRGMEEFARTGQGPVLGKTTEAQARDRAGRVFPVEVTLSAFQMDEEWFSVGTVRDITARKRAEEAIRESERRLGDIIDFLPDSTLVIDAQGRVLAWNRAMEQLTGASKAEMLGKGDYEYAMPFYGRRCPILANLVMEWDEELAGRYLHIRHEGGQLVSESFHPHLGEGGVYLASTASILRDASGAVMGAIETSRDITSRIRMEERLREREAFFRAVFDNAGVGIVDIGPDGLYQRANQTFLTMLGYTWEELQGKGPVDVTHPDDRLWTVGSVERLTTGQVASTRAEKRYLRKDGTEIWGDMVAVPILDQEGRVRSAVATITDITERKRAEALMVEKEVAEEAAQRAEEARADAETAQRELQAKLEEIERFNRLALGREERVIELKRQANTLAALAGFQKPYADYVEEIAAEVEEEAGGSLEEESEIDARRLADILAVDQFRKLLDDFCQSVGIAAAIIDNQGNVLATSRWQRACTDFHRQSPITCARCVESDTELAAGLAEGKQYAFYRCKNGLTDAASPIYIDGRHLANTFVGQFFTAPPDMDYFRRQAEEAGYDTQDYLAAIAEVPVVDESRLPSILNFLVGMSSTVTASYSERLRAQRAEEAMARRADETLRERAAALSLAEDAEEARAEIEQYKGRLELLVAERTEELKVSEERSRLLLHSAGEGIFGVDGQGLLTFVNPAALQMLGFAEAELMNRPVHPLIHHTRADGNLYPVEDCPMHASCTNGSTHNVDDEVLWRKDGSSFPVEYSSTPITKDGRVVGAVITFRDVSARKRAEEELRQYLQDLERFNRLTLGREERMIELKREINALLDKDGQAHKYRIVDEGEAQ